MHACCVPSRFSHVWLFATLWIVARQAPLSLGLFRQEYRSGLPCPPSGDLLDPGTEPTLLTSPALEGEFFTTSTTWETKELPYRFPNAAPFYILSNSAQGLWFLHVWLNGHEFEQAPGDGEGKGSLACCSPWGRKESERTKKLNTSESVQHNFECVYIVNWLPQ